MPALAVGVWGQVIPMSWLAIRESTSALKGLTQFTQVFDDAIPFLGIQMLMAVVSGDHPNRGFDPLHALAESFANESLI